MENWEQVGKAARIAADSQGNATAKMEAYTDSVEAAKNRITAAVEKLTMDINLDGLLKTLYKVTGGLIENIGLISGAVVTYLAMFKGKSLFSGLFGGGKFLSNAMYKMVDIGSGANRQGSLYAALKNEYGDGQWREKLNDMAAAQARADAERKFFSVSNPKFIGTSKEAQAHQTNASNFLKLGSVSDDILGVKSINAEGVAGAASQNAIRESISKYVLQMDAEGNAIKMSTEQRKLELSAMNMLMSTEEKLAITDGILTDAEIELAESQAKDAATIRKGLLGTERLEAMTDMEIKAMEEELLATEKLNMVMQKYAATMSQATTQQKEQAYKNLFGTKGDPNAGVKLAAQGFATSLMTGVGAFIPMITGGALGESLGMDSSTAALTEMMGMSALGNTAAKNFGALTEGVKAMSAAAKAASGAEGIGAALSAFTAIPGAALGAVGAIGLLVGAIAMIAAKAQKEAREKRAEDYKDSKAAYDKIIDATATFSDSKYTHYAAGVDKYGNNVSLTDEEYDEFVQMSNQLAEALPQLVTYTDEVGNKFLALGEDAKNLGENLEAATAAAQKARDRDLLATRDDQKKVYDKEVTDVIEKGNVNTYKKVISFLNGEKGSSANKEVKDFLKTQGLEVTAMGKILNSNGVEASQSEVQNAINAAQSALDENTTAVNNLSSQYADYIIAFGRQKLGYDANGMSNYEQMDEEARARYESMANSGLIDFTNEEQMSRALEFAQTMDWDAYETAMRDTNASAKDYAEFRESLANTFTEVTGGNFEGWEAEAAQLGFQVENGQLYDTLNVVQQINDIAGENALSNWGIDDANVKQAQQVYQWLQEGKVTAEESAEAVQNMLAANDSSDKGIKARAEANSKVTEESFGNYVNSLLESGEEATYENIAEYFGGISDNVAGTILKDAKELTQLAQAEEVQDKNEVADKEVKNAQDKAAALRDEANSAKKIADANPKDWYSVRYAQVAQENADNAQKEADAVKEKVEAYKKSGTSGDERFDKQVEKNYLEKNGVGEEDQLKSKAKAYQNVAAASYDAYLSAQKQEKAIEDSLNAQQKLTKSQQKGGKAAKSTEKSAKNTSKYTKKDLDAAKKKTKLAEKQYKSAHKANYDFKEKGVDTQDLETAKKVEREEKKINKRKVKNNKDTVNKMLKDNKKYGRDVVKAVDASELEESLNKATEGYQKFFSAIEDENGNGYLDTWNELRQGFEAVNEGITRTSNAMDEQKKYGKLSAQTVLELLSADENYIDVLEVKDGKIQLAANAEEAMAQAQMAALKSQIEAQIEEIATKEMEIAAILAAGEATDSELESIGSKVEGQNQEINATNASTVASYAAANAALKLAAGYDTAGNAAAAAIPKLTAYNRAVAGSKHVKAGATSTKTQTVSSGSYGSAPTTKDANFKVEKPKKLTEDQKADLRKQLTDLQNKRHDLEALKGNLDDVKGFKAGYEPGGGKSGSGGGGGGGGDKYTKLDHVKDILQAINKEYQQMVAYNDKLGVGHRIEVSYYDKKRKYLKEEIKLLKSKMASDFKKSDKSDYYQDIQDYQQAQIDLANLDDEKIQDEIDLLDARKELTGIAYKYEIGLYKQLLKTADTEQERLEYEKKLIDAQREEIQNQKEIAEAMRETLSLENAMMLAYRGLTQTYKKTSTGYTLVSDLQGLSGVTIKGTDGHTATGFDNATNQKRAAAVKKAKKKHKYVKVGKDDTGTLQYAYSDKSAANAEKALAEKIQKANTQYSSDAIDADWAYITDSFGTKHWYPKSKANSTTVKNIKNYKKKGYYVAVSVDNSGKLHFAKHKKTKKYTKKKAKKNLNIKARQFKDNANANIQHQDGGGSTQEHNKDEYLKAVKTDVKTMRTAEAESGATIAAIEANTKDRVENLEREAAQIVKERQTYTKDSADWVKLGSDYDDKIHEILEAEKEMVQTKIDLLEAAGINNQLLIAEYENLVKTSTTLQEEWENQKKLNDARKDYNSLLRDTLEYKYALYDNILEYESYTPSKDANSQYMKAISAQKDILEEELKMAKENAEEYRKMAFDANVRANLEYGMSEQEAKDQAWKDSANDSDYQEAVNQYVEAFQKMGELVVRQFNDIADAIGRKLDKMEQARAENWVTTWKNAYSLVYQDKDVKIKVTEDGSIKDYEAIMDKWDSYDAEKMVPATTKIKEYYNAVIQMQEQIKAEALATLNDVTNKVTYLTDEQVSEIVEKYNEAAVEIHQAMIDQMQDTVDYQDTLYNAVVDEVNDIIFNLEKQKELTEEMYDDEIESLQKKEDSIQRTNDLLEKQKALQDALNDRQRVYRAGKIMPMTNYIG